MRNRFFKEIFTIFIILLFSLSVFSQEKKDTLLVFNNKLPLIDKGIPTYYLGDLLLTDTIKTNIPNLIISDFFITCKCINADWGIDTCILTPIIKSFLKGCLSKNNDKVYIDNVVAVDQFGRKIKLRSYLIYIRQKL